MKKFLSLLLTIAIIAQMLVVPVFAEESAAADTTPVVPVAEDTSPVTPEVEVEKETTTASFTAENLSGNPAGTTVDVTHVPAESVSVSEDTLSLDLAGTTTAALSASILPEDTTDIITWSSDNGAVATVDENGNVAAVSVGTANITASTVSSQDGGSTVSAICAVTVTCSHNMEHCLCTLCGYSDPASVDYVASVASPFEAPFYFATLKEAVEFAHTIPREERPFVAVEKDCTIDETITISDGINIFSSVQGENRSITVTADTAFELTGKAFLLINYLDIDTTGSYIFKLTSNGNGVQMSDTNLSGATDSAFYVPEGVERNGIQFYGGSISAHTAITMNGNQGGFTIAGDGAAIDVSNPEGAFVLNGSNYEGQVFGVTLTNSAENGVAFSLSNTSSFRNGGMTFNGINDYWNPHYNQPSGKIMPNKGAAARVDITYYGNVQAAVKAASELPTTDEEGNVIEGTIAITIIGNLPAAETLTLDAKRPIDLYATGNSPQILLETGAVLNVNQTTKLHNATIYVCNGAAINGLEHIDLTDGGKIVYEEITRDPVAQIGNTTYASIEEALAAAKAGDTVTLLADAETSVLVVASGVTLDLGTYNLTADYIVAFNGGYINAKTNSGSLTVPRGNLILNEGVANGSYTILPVWDPTENVYKFSNFMAYTDNNKRKLRAYETEGRIEFQFTHIASTAINSSLLADNGSSDNGVSVIVRLEWKNEDGTAYQNFVFNDGFVKTVAAAGNRDYILRLNGTEALEINLETLCVTAIISTESGAEACGTVWTIENAN